MIRFLISNRTNPYDNIAVENYLLDDSPVDAPTLYLWRNRQTVVIGQNQNPFAECDVEALLADGGHLMRRKTGGGAVYHDGGNLNFSFVMPRAIYDQPRQFSVIQRAVESFGLRTQLSGRNDILASAGSDLSPQPSDLRKFSGNAFSRGATRNLHHGTLLIDGNVADMQRYLKPSKAKLMKHGVASVQSRVVNLRELNPELTASSLTVALRSAFEEVYGEQAVDVDFESVVQQPEVCRLSEHFASEEWIFGRWRHFQAQRSAHFAWGGVELALSVEDSRIAGVQIASDALDLAAIDEARRLLTGASLDVRPHADNPVVRDILSLVY